MQKKPFRSNLRSETISKTFTCHVLSMHYLVPIVCRPLQVLLSWDSFEKFRPPLRAAA